MDRPLARLSSTSSPDVVRTYLSTILRDKHNVPDEESRAIASNWKYGRGAELFYYDAETFRGMFGSEPGMLLYRAVRGDKTQPRPAAKRDLFGFPPGLFLLVFFLVLMTGTAYGAYANWNDAAASNGLAEASFAGCFVSGIGFVVSYLLYYGIVRL